MVENPKPESPIKLQRRTLMLTVPTGLEIALTYTLAGMTLVVASDAVIPPVWVPYGLCAFLIVLIYAVVRGGIAAITCLLIKRRPQLTGWLLIIIGCAIIGTSDMTDIDMRLRLWLSEDSFLRQADRLQRLPQERRIEIPSERHMWNYGLFTGHVFHIQDDGHTVWFKTQEGTWPNSPTGAFYGGVVYVESGEPFLQGEFAWDHLYGQWWVWRYID